MNSASKGGRSRELSRRAVKVRYLQTLKRLGVFKLARRAARGRLRILCYHGIWLGPKSFAGDSMFMLDQDFGRRLRMIKDLGYEVLPLARAVELLQSGRLPAEAVVITIDDGWYGTHRVMLPILHQLRLPATLYCDTAHLEWRRPIPHVMAAYLKKCLPTRFSAAAQRAYQAATDFSSLLEDRLSAAKAFASMSGIDVQPFLEDRVFDYMAPSELRAIRAGGVDVQLHTHRHTLHDFSVCETEREIEDNRHALTRLLGAGAFQHFCYPSGEYMPNTGETLAKLGVHSATTLRSDCVQGRARMLCSCRD